MPVLHTAMSLIDMDRLPRMKDTIKPEDLNTNACVKLAETVLKDAAEDYICARRRADACPSKENLAHLRTCREFYLSDWFLALSGGVAEGSAVVRELDRIARGRRKP